MGKEIIRKWMPDNFKLETNTVWSFPERGDWATHDGNWRGNWSPYIPRNILLRYSNEGDWVLDQFAGGGTTLVEAKLLKRNVIGIDINIEALERCEEKVSFSHPSANGQVHLKQGDARHLDMINDNSIDLICTHPPYADILQYSSATEGDLSLLPVEKFISEMKLVAEESYRVLKREKYCAVLIGDIRKHGDIIPLSFEIMKVFQDVGFSLKEMIIKKQHNCSSTSYWKERSKQRNFLLIAHEHLFVFRK